MSNGSDITERQGGIEWPDVRGYHNKDEAWVMVASEVDMPDSNLYCDTNLPHSQITILTRRALEVLGLRPCQHPEFDRIIVESNNAGNRPVIVIRALQAPIGGAPYDRVWVELSSVSIRNAMGMLAWFNREYRGGVNPLPGWEIGKEDR